MISKHPAGKNVDMNYRLLPTGVKMIIRTQQPL